jgi:gamma-glutamyltranspeptidase/glutathione hydrolase
MTNQLPRVHEMEHHAADWATTRPVVAGTQGVVVAGHPLVSMAGLRMLLAGGNAFDAAVAAGFAAAVVEPTASYTLCGECVAVVHDARTRAIHAVSGQGTAPGLATVEFFRSRGLDRIPTGPGPQAHLSFTVPGAVDAYLTVLETFGTKTVSEVLAPAVDCAERGFPMYEYMHRMLAIPETRPQFDVYPPGGTAVFYPNGQVPAVGDLFVQPALARTLRRLVEADAQARGDRAAGIGAARARFYRGDIAAQIGAFSERLGGLLRAADLAAYRARLEPPLPMAFAGREIVGQSAWTQGPVLLQALGMLATFDLRAMGHNSSRYVHVVTEALKLAFADRERYYGDVPNVPLTELLSPAYARARAAHIRLDRASAEAPPAGDPRDGGPPAAMGAPRPRPTGPRTSRRSIATAT